jgi:co-chaperonin GroES (HSP10)
MRGQLIVQKIEEKEDSFKNQSGIYIPNAPLPLNRGVVVRVGGGELNVHNVEIPMQVEEGDVVTWPPMNGIAIEHAGQEYFCILEKAIIVIEDKE